MATADQTKDVTAVRRIGENRRAPIEPLRFEIVGTGEIPDSEPVTVYQPDGGVMMAVGKIGNDVEAMLRLFLGSDWEKVRAQFEAGDYQLQLDALQEIGEHFKIQDYFSSVEGNRAERRRLGRGNRR